MAFWGHTLGRKNVFLTCLYTWYVYDGSAAWRVIYTAMPQVGCSFVKMRNKWLPRASEEKPPFLKKVLSRLSVVEGPGWQKGSFLYKLNAFTLRYTEAVLKCLLLLWHSRGTPTPAPGRTEPPFPEAQLSFFLTQNLMVGRSVVFL